MNKRSNYYQIALIVLGSIATLFFALFFYKEFFPEYKIFQKDYIALENFRSTYTNKAPPEFKEGVKQIVIEVPDNGPVIIDRCTSCHVALDVPYFSPTKIERDLNGNVVYDENANPVQIENEDYIWKKLDQKIADLTNEQDLRQLKELNDTAEIDKRLKQAKELSNLKTATINGVSQDVTKALRMHPLMGKETRPFEFHPVSDYGCTSCHGGNGRALTVDKAHGPVFDGEYEIEETGHTRVFLEKDEKNDPKFSKVFNNKPGHKLIFQTTPILVGNLMQAKCMQCHNLSKDQFRLATDVAQDLLKQSLHNQKILEIALNDEKKSIEILASLKRHIKKDGIEKTKILLQSQLDNFRVSTDERQRVLNELNYISSFNNSRAEDNEKELILAKIDYQLKRLLGSSDLVKQLDTAISNQDKNLQDTVSKFIQDNSDKDLQGSFFIKQKAYISSKDLSDLNTALKDSPKKTPAFLKTDVDVLTSSYAEGKRLYVEQACYACHRIAGFSRGGIGPELTTIGKNYPWYIKRHIVWPQGDVPASTMPTFRLDHEELESLMTYLLAQRGVNESVSKVDYKKRISEWETSRDMPWEQPISPTKIYDINYAKTVFAVEGCASCHRLKGFESDVGYAIEKDNPKVDFGALYKEREWFTKIFPEEMLGSEIAKAIAKNAKEIDLRIVDHVRNNSILESIEDQSPGVIESFYSNFKFAFRAKDHEYKEAISKETDPLKQQELKKSLEEYKNQVRRVLMIYVQEYGLGRLIGPRPNWSGIYRSDDWLMEHFKKPGAYIARSIMPVFPFDETKFYALTNMLNVVGKQNQQWGRNLFEKKGFNPSLAYQMHCSQCHGEFLGGNGPVAEWIYPIPKNLKNVEFLRNLTKERVMNSIVHGVDGTPMAPWGEVAYDKKDTLNVGPVLTENEIKQLTDWLFSTLPGSTFIQTGEDSLKWNYSPQDAIDELEKEGNELKSILSLDDNQNYYQLLKKEFLSKNILVDNGTNALPQSNNDISKYFDIIPQKEGSIEKNSYYIKKKYYTEENLQQGQAFFNVYCATCHGMDADGMGARSQAMRDAKPRMLTNLDWLDAHDDLDMLRSIKFGVAGTSMTPWGDQTTSLLRMQLVMYIRHLSQDAESQKKIETAIYETFNPMDVSVDLARLKNVKAIESLEKRINENEVKKTTIQEEEKLLENYKISVDLNNNLKHLKNIDSQYLKLKSNLAEERKIYKNFAILLLSNIITKPLSENLKDLLATSQNRLRYVDGELEINNNNDEDVFLQIKIAMLNQVEENLKTLQKDQTTAESSIASAAKDQKLKDLANQIKSLTLVKQTISLNFQKFRELKDQQIEIVKNIKHQKT